MCSIFSEVEPGPPIEVFSVNKACIDCPNDKKVNLSVGAYRTEEGKPWVLPVVRKTQIQVAQDTSINCEYLPVVGTPEYTKAATALLLGSDSPAIKEGRAFGVQTLSGTGALRVGSEFLATVLKREIFYYSTPTWGNHPSIFLSAGFTTGKKYRYWDSKKRGLDIDGLLEDLNNAPACSVIILHACAHNPTGCDPTQEQWKKIADVMEAKKLFPFFDAAYQGFASGDPDRDAWAVRYFVSRGFELVCAQSFAKNFGLYCERAGNLTVVQYCSKSTDALISRFSLVIRSMYSNPPAYGVRVVERILNNPELRAEWMECIKTMAGRIKSMRTALRDNLVKLNTPGDWNHIVEQIGMFCYTGLNEKQVKILRDEYHIYLLSSGRINMCGLNCHNVEYVAKAIDEVERRQL